MTEIVQCSTFDFIFKDIYVMIYNIESIDHSCLAGNDSCLMPGLSLLAGAPTPVMSVGPSAMEPCSINR